MNGRFRLFVLALVALFISGCSVFDRRPPEEIVLERAEQHLAALRAGDFALALEYTTPAFQASAQGRRYRAMYSAAPTWRNAEIYAVECEEVENPQRCLVRTRIYPFVPPHIQANITDLPISVKATWIIVNGRWYRFEE